MNRYIAEVQVTLTLEIESVLSKAFTMVAILDSFADPHGPDPLSGATVRIRSDRLIARTRGAVLCAGSARLEEATPA
jgi:hypothetical protein